MTLPIEYFDAAGTVASDGVFIPLADLPGVTASEFSASESVAKKDAKAMLAVLTVLNAYIADETNTVLGVTSEENPPAGVDINILQKTFVFSFRKFVDYSLDAIADLPLPTTGLLNGLGGIAISAIFPGATKLAGGTASTPGAGLVIQTAGLAKYAPVSQTSITVGSDSRTWFTGLLQALALDAERRSGTVVSAIVTTTAGQTTGLIFPATYTVGTDPETGLALADLPKLGLVQRALSYTVELILNPSAQTYDVNVVTA